VSAAASAARIGWQPVLAGALLALATAGLGGLATELGPWYRQLRQPSWKPPDAAFGPAWTLIFTLTAAAGVRAWSFARDRAARHRVLAAYLVSALLNVLWSVLFFKLRRPDWALAEVVLMWLSIVWLIVESRRHDRLAPWLLAPYLAWVAFAAALNLAVVRLNGPF
jgi:translocator protein